LLRLLASATPILVSALVPAVAAAQTVSIQSGPPQWTNQTSASFRLAADDATQIECRLDGIGGWDSCSEEHTVPGPLGEGRHVLEARAAGGSGQPEDEWVWRVDLRPPTALTFLDPVGLWQTRRVVPVAWSASDASSGIGFYTLRYDMWSARGRSWTGIPWITRSKVTGAGFPGTPGRTYCVEGIAEDRAGNRSAGRSPSRCFAVPLDDGAFERNDEWKRKTGRDGFFRESFVQTRDQGAWARRRLVARRLILLATKCATCGSVTIRWRGRVVKTIDLERATTMRSARIPIAHFAQPRRGVLRLDVTSNGKLVRIDGLGVSAV
jgi:hypothetical protein